MVIYRLLNTVTGQSYIGATRQSLTKRLQGHRHRADYPEKHGGMNLVAKAIREYGWDVFEVSEVGRAQSFAELMEMEKEAIVLFRSLTPFGYNQLPGGQGLNAPMVSGHPAWNKGVPHTLAARAKMSKARKGEKNFRARAMSIYGVEYPTMQLACDALGLSRSQMYRRIKTGVARWLTPERPGKYGSPKGRKATPEQRQKMSAARKGKPKPRIKYEARRYSNDALPLFKEQNT